MIENTIVCPICYNIIKCKEINGKNKLFVCTQCKTEVCVKDEKN